MSIPRASSSLTKVTHNRFDLICRIFPNGSANAKVYFLDRDKHIDSVSGDIWSGSK
jgi:hypothetical protein